ncbi:MAG: hypothetical protein WCF85_07020 [Rhodospirillaceae bacterium]
MPSAAGESLESRRRDGARRWAPSLPVLIWLGMVALPLTAALKLLNDPDTYWHIEAGRWMLSHHAVPFFDPFSHSLPGAPWFAHEWLAELIFALVYQYSGWNGTILVAVFSFAAALALLTRFLLPHFKPIHALLAVALGAGLTMPHLLVRPHVLAFPILVLWVAALVRARDNDASPPWRALPLMVLWVNLHGGFLFGLALAGFFMVEAVLSAPDFAARRREAGRWTLFVLLAGLVSALNPRGFEALLFPFHVLGQAVLQAEIIEWKSVDFQQFQVLEVCLLGLLALGFSTGVRLPLTRTALLLLLVHMALKHQRHGDLLGLCAPLVVAAPLGAQLRLLLPKMTAAEHRASRPASAGAVALAGLLTLGLAAGFSARPIERVDGPNTPHSALLAAQALGLSGPVFNAHPFGGYLIFNGVAPFIDGRLDMYGDAFWSRHLRAYTGDRQALLSILHDYRIRWTMLESGSPAVGVLDHLPGWQRVYTDGFAVIHRYSSPGSD